MDFQVLIADSAIDDLREIVSFVTRDDPAAALRLGRKLIDQALSLAKLPHRFPFRDQRRRIRKITLRPYLIFYWCDDATARVHVLHFWHGARRAPGFLE